jgi:predicted nucleic acid-binding protein
VAALLSRDGQNRRIIRACLENRIQPVMGQTLFLEYEDLLGRDDLYRRSPLSSVERQQLFDAFLSVCSWVHVYYGWRPNLGDEGDTHVVELAVAAGVSAIITNNVADFRRGELKFPEIRVLTPAESRKEFL